MGALEGFLKQIRELLSTMTPSARIMAALMAGVVVVSLGWIVTTQQSSQMEYLLGNQTFSDEELNKMERALGESGLREYERVGARLKIPKVARDQYVKALAEGRAMPDSWTTSMDNVWSASSNPLTPPSVLAERVKYARQNDLSKILTALPGVARAYVAHDEKEGRFGRGAHQSASVFLQGVNNEAISQELMRQISQQVVAYFPGLKPEHVSVMDLGTGSTFLLPSDPVANDQQILLNAQRMWEQHYRDKVMSELRIYGDVKLGVIVELDPTLKKEREELKSTHRYGRKQSNQRQGYQERQAAPGGRTGVPTPTVPAVPTSRNR